MSAPSASPGDAPYPSWNKGKSTVVMVEPITANHTVDGSGSMDVRPLLRLMDICTCAAAEKHTGVNCVTASCGDIVLEHVPRCGELLELTATPVYAGRTSLDIGLNVLAAGHGGARRFVCYASFTYVTTRDTDGKKRMCPPLYKESVGEADGDDAEVPEDVRWERIVANYRRALVKAEMKSSTMVSNEMVGSGSGFDLEFTEVVLPAHLNHMQHTFGGIVMGWMCQAALAEASRKSKRGIGSLQIRSVMRIEFASGSDVSNHLVFRPRLNAIFDEERSAEVEVRVARRSIETGLETHMNTGYFYISGVDSSEVFSSSLDFVSGRRETMIRGRVRSDATWRRRLLLARRNLLGGLGEAVEWHPALKDEAPLMTILAVLRLVQHNDPSVEWTPLLRDEGGPARRLSRFSHYMNLRPGLTNFEIEVMRCEWLGAKKTFILRARGMIVNTTVKTLFGLIKDRRPEWDEICNSVRPIESASCPNDDEEGVCWDIVQHTAITPARAVLLGYLCSCFTCSLPHALVPLCLLRAWKTADDGNGETVMASRSVTHPEAEDSLTEVLPSGWFLSPVGGGPARVSVTYVIEHDLRYLHQLVPTFTDEQIIDLMAKTVRQYFSTFESMAATDDPKNYGSID